MWVRLLALVTLAVASGASPPPPANLTVVKPSSHEAHLLWIRPQTDRPLGYVLFYEERGASGAGVGGPPRNITLGNPRHADDHKLRFTLKGLRPHARYRVWVRAFYLDWAPQPPPDELGPASEKVDFGTEVEVPSAPVLKRAQCTQPSGMVTLHWTRPDRFSRIDHYTVTSKLLDSTGRTEEQMLDSNISELERVVTNPLTIYGNASTYEITVQAVSMSAVNKGVLINGTKSKPVQVIMTPDCVPADPIGSENNIESESQYEKESVAVPVVMYIIIFLVFLIMVLLVILGLYRVGCTTVFKKCFPVSYLFLEEGGAVGGNEGCDDVGSSGKDEVQVNCIKKAASPTHAVIFWGTANNSETVQVNNEQLWDEHHPPVAADKFLAHTSALHADGDIGFSKEYELIQTKSSMLGHTSHHSHHPDNRHKNRYLNITAYDHSRVCLLPSSSCTCEPGNDHRKSCIAKTNSPPASDSPPHCDYVNANFIDGIVAEIDEELAKFIIEQNNKRKMNKKKIESDVWITVDESQKTRSLVCSDNPSGDCKPLLDDVRDGNNAIKSKLSLDLERRDDKKILSPGTETLANACRLSINLDRKENKQEPDTKSEKTFKETKNRKRSTSADTRDIVVDKKSGSRGHSKNSSVVVTTIDNSPLNGSSKIDGGFLNIEFTGIVDSEKELQRAKEAENSDQADKVAKEAAEGTLEDLDDLYVQIDGNPFRVNSSWLLDRRRYIGTQGPTPGTLPAFWRMVWDHKVIVLVMITNLVERGRRKCDMYWPKEGTETYGIIQVTTLKEDVMATYTVRTFHIKNTKVNVSRSVFQYHYTVWPDHGTPEHPLAVLRFREAARKAAPPQAGSILVHCSAGVGRTGTYIVLDAMLNHLRLTGSLNVFGFLCHIRSQRNFLVQTEEQYIFIHDALLEAIQSGDTEVLCENSKEYLKKLLEPFPKDYVQDPIFDYKCGLFDGSSRDKLNMDNAIEDVTEKIKSLAGDDIGYLNWGGANRIPFGEDKTLRECQNDIVSVALFEAKSRANRSDNDRKSVAEINDNIVNISNNHVFNGESTSLTDYDRKESNLSNNADSAIIIDDTSPETVPEDCKSDAVIIDIENLPLPGLNIKRSSPVDGNIETTSINSMNTNRSNNSNSYEKLNGVSAKVSEESKASSVSNEDVELSYNDNNCNGVNVNGAKDEKNILIPTNGDNSHTITSSISSDTNNINMINFKDKLSNYSPGPGNQENGNAYGRNRTYRNKSDDNYELLSNACRPGGINNINADFFAGGHQFACQRKDFNAKKPRNLLEQQFKLITLFEPNKFHLSFACKQVNINKNRRNAVLPIDSGRVHLVPKPGIEGTDYINATWLQGHRSLREYIVTQHPLPNTVIDFYRLLWDHSCQIVVVLTDLAEDGECKQFWPSEKNPILTLYNYSIHYGSQEKYVAKRATQCSQICDRNFKKLPDDNTSLDTPSQSPSSNKNFPIRLNKTPQKLSPVSLNNDENLETEYYTRQFSGDNQDEEKLIPRQDETPSLDCSEELDELKKLNSETNPPDGYAFDRNELCVETCLNNEIPDGKPSPKKLIPNGEPSSPAEEVSKKVQKSPSKLSLKNFKLSSPILKSPTKFKFDFGAKSTQEKKSPTECPEQQTVPSFESKFVMIPFVDLCQLREGTEEIGMDCVISATNITMNSLQDDYELKIKLIECPKWLADLDYDESSDTEEDSDDEDYEMESKDLNFVIDQRLRAYKGVFALPEYMSRCQDEMKNSPVVIIDKTGGARAVALCTLGGLVRRQSRDVYSLAKLHHGRRAGAWRRPSDIRALYESIAAYDHPADSASDAL